MYAKTRDTGNEVSKRYHKWCIPFSANLKNSFLTLTSFSTFGHQIKNINKHKSHKHFKKIPFIIRNWKKAFKKYFKLQIDLKICSILIIQDKLYMTQQKRNDGYSDLNCSAR